MCYYVEKYYSCLHLCRIFFRIGMLCVRKGRKCRGNVVHTVTVWDDCLRCKVNEAGEIGGNRPVVY